MRVGARFYVQTPNYFIPIEPHFLFPGSQFISLNTRALLLTRFALGNYERIGDFGQAAKIADSIHLLSRSNLQSLFPDATIEREWFLGLTKSFLVSGGW